jgi:predicted histone-like DNA-binding protein
MAKYIKQEMADLNGNGETKAYYRMKTIRNIGMKEFIEIMTRYGGLTEGIAIAALTQASDTLAELMGMGYTVSIDGFGTFKATVGLKRFKEMDTIDGNEAKRNAQSLCVDGVNFKADKELVKQVSIKCKLERSHVSRLRKSPYSREERVALALKFIEENGFMRLIDYVQLTRLSRSTACRELMELCADKSSGIDTVGRRTHKVYVKRREEFENR